MKKLIRILLIVFTVTLLAPCTDGNKDLFLHSGAAYSIIKAEILCRNEHCTDKCTPLCAILKPGAGRRRNTVVKRYAYGEVSIMRSLKGYVFISAVWFLVTLVISAVLVF